MEEVVHKLELCAQQPTPLADQAKVQPSLLENVTLHDYQLKGVQWLRRKYEQGLNPILGDEMGLGKTLQVIAFIAALVAAEQENKMSSGKKYLIIAPLSVLLNWMEQFEQFAPCIHVVMYIGPAKDRGLTRKIIATSPSDQSLVVVTSYDMVLYDHEFLHRTRWEVIILDEGHRLKNPKSQLHKTVSTRLQSEYMAILTGTPIQNDLEELFALLSVLNPSVFKDQKLFESTFRDYFSAKAQRLDVNQCAESKRLNKAEKLMQRLLAPLLLLRTVEDVQGAFTLPPLSEIVVHTPMSAMQRAYYKEVIARNAEVLNNRAKAQGSRLSLLNILPQLRKACNHPYLFPGAEPEPFMEGKHLYENSGKLFVLHEILPRLKQKGHRVLLFSQSPPFLDIIQDFLTLEGLAYERIDGSVRGKERWQSIERFQKDPETFVFLISTRAGGVGLNLQSADTVIFMDSDYNPQTDLQAVARAYRLGQTKPIHVIKFLCANTVEESIYRRALKKMRMADRIRQLARRKESNNDEEYGEELGTALLDMIQFGLHRLMEADSNEGEDEVLKPLEEEFIERILFRKSDGVIEEKGTSGDDLVQALKGDKLLESGGDFCEENMYYFEGEDYKKVLSTKVKDAELMHKLCTEAANCTKRQTKAARKRYEQEEANEDEEDEERAIENEAERAQKRTERRQKALERKLALWKANKYTSAAINIDVEQSPTRISDGSASGRLYYKSGDASRPLPSSLRGRPYIIVHCVDNSGVWCSRGFFRSLSLLSPTIQKTYEAAGRNGDLKLGSAHLIQLPSQATTDSQTITVDQYVCFLVVQGFIGKKKQRLDNGSAQLVRQGKSSTFRLNALDTALQALAHRALELCATVHLPRIGYGTPNFNWYAVERLLARNLRDVGIEATIYYYSPRQKNT